MKQHRLGASVIIDLPITEAHVAAAIDAGELSIELILAAIRAELPSAPRRRATGEERLPAVLSNSREALTGGPARVARRRSAYSESDDLLIIEAGTEGDAALAALASKMGVTAMMLRARYRAILAQTERELGQ